MPLVTSEKMLLDAQAGKYAIGAFNVENMEMVKAVIAAAEELKAPVILQVTPTTVKYGTLETYYAIVAAEAGKVGIPICLHLDHGNSFELVLKALKAGFTSVMIDGSGESFEGNVEITKKITEAARACEVPVEAELGRIGGKEDDLTVAINTDTDPLEAKVFADCTGISSLAVAIGTAHGFYTDRPVLNKLRISEIKEKVSVPLVLHGASGLRDEEIKECIQRGICKVNFATELRTAYTAAIKQLLSENLEIFDPKKLGLAGIAAVKDLVKERIKICGCDGKADASAHKQ